MLTHHDPDPFLLHKTTAYFYLDKPASQLPSIQPYAQRVGGLATSADATKRVDA